MNTEKRKEKTVATERTKKISREGKGYSVKKGDVTPQRQLVLTNLTNYSSTNQRL